MFSSTSLAIGYIAVRGGNALRNLRRWRKPRHRIAANSGLAPVRMTGSEPAVPQFSGQPMVADLLPWVPGQKTQVTEHAGAGMNSRGKASTRVATALLAFVALGLAGCGSTAVADDAAASPTPDAPVAAVDVAVGQTDDDVDVAVAAGTDGVGVTFREITIAPGAGTGKHCHDGQLIGVVKQGTLTHYAPTHEGGVHEYAEGDAIVEGSGYVHEGVNEGDVDVVLWVTYVIPEGDPLAETDLTLCES
jgi:quercetin dioxygenase-like cupin family protein